MTVWRQTNLEAVERLRPKATFHLFRSRRPERSRPVRNEFSDRRSDAFREIKAMRILAILVLTPVVGRLQWRPHEG